jgi:hypothetical protein
VFSLFRILLIILYYGNDRDTNYPQRDQCKDSNPQIEIEIPTCHRGLCGFFLFSHYFYLVNPIAVAYRCDPRWGFKRPVRLVVVYLQTPLSNESRTTGTWRKVKGDGNIGCLQPSPVSSMPNAGRQLRNSVGTVSGSVVLIISRGPRYVNT